MRRLAPVVALLLLAPACGDSGGGPATTPDTTAGADVDDPDATEPGVDFIVPDAAPDAGPDAAPDAPTVPDAPLDVPLDVPLDTGPDTTPPSTACPPPAAGLPDLPITGAGRWWSVAAVSYPGLLDRGLRIYLPAAYDDDPDRRFPVLYMHDGQNCFQDADASFGVEWQVDETLDALTTAGVIEPHIAVGIDNTAERIKDYTPSVDPGTMDGGKGDLYAALLADVVKPFLDANFRTRCGPGDAAVAGSSLGGIISLHIAVAQPGVFDRVGVVSPSLWWNGGEALGVYEAFPAADLPERMWLDEGTAEGTPGVDGAPPLLVERLRVLRDTLLAKGMTFGDRLGVLEDEGALHNEAAWAHRLPSILAFLLAPERPVDQPVTALSMFPYAPALPAGGTTTVAVEALHDDLVRLTWPPDAFTFDTTAPGVATIGPDGAITAHALGETTLTATGFGHTAELPFAVLEDGGLVDVAFEVTVPPETPPDDVIHISGNLAELGTWSGAGPPLTKAGEHFHTLTLALPHAADLEFKFTRGSWASVEKDADGFEILDRTATVAPGLVVEAEVGSWADLP